MAAMALGWTAFAGRQPALCASTRSPPYIRANASAIWLRLQFSLQTKRTHTGRSRSIAPLPLRQTCLGAVRFLVFDFQGLRWGTKGVFIIPHQLCQPGSVNSLRPNTSVFGSDRIRNERKSRSQRDRTVE